MGEPERTFTPAEIAEFWEKHPCGNQFVDQKDWREFFQAYDSFKYTHEPHIPGEIGKLQVRGKRILEIGLGQGAEAQQLIQAGAIYNGVDITNESIERVRLRCSLFGLAYESLQVMNAEKLDFPDESFDLVFSHGVIHHSPRIAAIVSEIHRVLKVGGRAVVMVYHKNSLNYHVSIRVMRRIGIFLLWIPGFTRIVSTLTREPVVRLEKHLVHLRNQGLNYLKMENFIHKSTDGPDNVYSMVLTKGGARDLFKQFRELEFTAHFLNERQLPVLRTMIPTRFKERIAARFGWHLWIKGTK